MKLKQSSFVSNDSFEELIYNIKHNLSAESDKININKDKNYESFDEEEK